MLRKKLPEQTDSALDLFDEALQVVHVHVHVHMHMHTHLHMHLHISPTHAPLTLLHPLPYTPVQYSDDVDGEEVESVTPEAWKAVVLRNGLMAPDPAKAYCYTCT